jgi:chromate transporter
LAGAHFALVLAIAGSVYLLAQRGYRAAALVVVSVAIAAVIAWVAANGLSGFAALTGSSVAAESVRVSSLSLPALFWSGLKAGLLTFGGAYTVIPFLQRDAVTHGAWMSNAQFLDGLALSGLLPAPLIIFSTFVGYLGGGPWGAVAMTAGIFLPAFAFTLVGHDALERWVHHPRIRVFLEGVTAGVVGLIAGTTIALLRISLTSPAALLLFGVVLAILFASRARMAIPAVIAGAALWGWVLSRLA